MMPSIAAEGMQNHFSFLTEQNNWMEINRVFIQITALYAYPALSRL